jgi:hypothetical protein
VFLLAALMVGACSSGTEPAAQPEPTVAIAEAPTATTAPAPEEAPTASPAPTPEPTAVEPTPDPQADEDAVIAAWKRYLDLGFAVRGKNPSAEALDFEQYLGGTAQERLKEVLAEQKTTGEYLSGSASSTDPAVEFRKDQTVVVRDCVAVEFAVHQLDTDAVISVQDELRSAAGQFLRAREGWILMVFDVEELCGVS